MMIGMMLQKDTQSLKSEKNSDTEIWEQVKALIDENRIDCVVKLCEGLNIDMYDNIVNKLITELKCTLNVQHRNTIAIVLGDLKCNSAIKPLIELIKNPPNKRCIGSLIYSLQELDCGNVIKEIIPVLYKGNYEARNMLYDLLEIKIKEISEQDKRICIDLLKKEKGELEEILEIVDGALDILHENL